MQETLRCRLEWQRAVQHSGVVPHDEVAPSPVVAEHELRLRRPLEEAIEQCARPCRRTSPTTSAAVAPRSSDLRPSRRVHTSGWTRVGTRSHDARSSSEASGFTRSCAAAKLCTTRSSAISALSCVRERVVRGVGAGELGVAAGVVDLACAEQRGLLRDGLGGAVDVPQEVALTVAGEQRVGLGRIERDRLDLGILVLTGRARPRPRPTCG